jgi:allantoinase
VEAEVAAIRMMVGLAREFGVHVHIVHVACAEAVEIIARAKGDGVRITAETCPHYLAFSADEIADGATEFKCAPPIREARHRDALWAGLQSGALDLVATDHSPAPPAMKCPGDFMMAWGGIASLELSLGATWTTVSSQRPASSRERTESTLAHMARWMSAAPAALAGFQARKGRIAEGNDADLVVWDPDATWTVDAARLQQRHKVTPYAGRALRGRVHRTYLRGELIWVDGQIGRQGLGQLL